MDDAGTVDLRGSEALPHALRLIRRYGKRDAAWTPAFQGDSYGQVEKDLPSGRSAAGS